MAKKATVDDLKLPKEYVPTSLREKKLPEREEVVYACGYEEKKGSYGMFHGPNPILDEMLEVVPEDAHLKAVIIRYNLDGTDEVIYQWSKDRWVRFVAR